MIGNETQLQRKTKSYRIMNIITIALRNRLSSINLITNYILRKANKTI